MTTKRTQLPASSSREALGCRARHASAAESCRLQQGHSAPAAPPAVVEVADVVQQDTPDLQRMDAPSSTGT